MITDKYRELNAHQHRIQHTYGCSGSKYASLVLDVVARVSAADVLDYGCGKQTLGGMIAHVVPCRGYDPAIPHLAAEPSAADLVACTDVMEHVEAQFIEDVLDHIKALSRKAAVFVISTERGGRRLKDGSLAHRSVFPPEWWKHKLEKRWKVEHSKLDDVHAYVCIC